MFKKLDATDLALIAGFAALNAVCAVLPGINVAGPVPITLQTFAVLLAGAVLGARRGFLAVLLYLVIGAAGLPVFASGASGLSTFTSASGGYLISFPLDAALTGFAVSLLPRRSIATNIPLVFVAAYLGVALSHACGIAGLHWFGHFSWTASWNIDKVFWLGDTFKAIAVGIVATAVHRAFPGLLPRRRLPQLSAATA